MSVVPFERAKWTFIENWPSEVAALSIPGVAVPLSLDDARALGASMSVHGSRFGRPRPERMDGIRSRLTAAFIPFHGVGAFPRLGSRSPKDSLTARREGMRARTPAQVLRLLTDGSKRIADDLSRAIAEDYPPVVHLRRWMEIPPWSELRCFIRDRVLVGVSQFDPDDEGASPELERVADEAFAAARELVEVLTPALPVEDVIADVFVAPTEEKRLHATLIEINPFHSSADWGLFADGDFDGTFRYHRSRRTD